MQELVHLPNTESKRYEGLSMDYRLQAMGIIDGKMEDRGGK